MAWAAYYYYLVIVGVIRFGLYMLTQVPKPGRMKIALGFLCPLVYSAAEEARLGIHRVVAPGKRQQLRAISQHHTT